MPKLGFRYVSCLNGKSDGALAVCSFLETCTQAKKDYKGLGLQGPWCRRTVLKCDVGAGDDPTFAGAMSKEIRWKAEALRAVAVRCGAGGEQL